MARRYYGLNKGQTEFSLTEGSSSGDKDLEVSVDLAITSMSKSDAFNLITSLKNFMLRGNWPAGATADYQRRWGMNWGDTENAVLTDISDYALLLNQTITYTAVTAGTAGNSITIALVDPAGNNQVLAVTVLASAISVSLATGVAGAITTTRAQLVAAINASAAASALVSASGAGATAITALAATALATGAAPTVANDDVYVDVKMSAALSTAEMVMMMSTIQNHITKGNWPPA
jgi:hypothetical protein